MYSKYLEKICKTIRFNLIPLRYLTMKCHQPIIMLHFTKIFLEMGHLHVFLSIHFKFILLFVVCTEFSCRSHDLPKRAYFRNYLHYLGFSLYFSLKYLLCFPYCGSGSFMNIFTSVNCLKFETLFWAFFQKSSGFSFLRIQ